MGNIGLKSGFGVIQSLSRKSRAPYLGLLSVGVFLVFLVRTAWLCDDAYISFRTVDNLVSGYGLTWNVAERVQSFSNPLWVLLLSVIYFFTLEIYFTSLALSIAVSLACIYILSQKIARNWSLALLAVGLPVFSNAFLDYSTSGLENALGHLLIVIFCLIYLSKEKISHRVFWMSFVAALGAVNRMDSILLYLPCLILAVAWNGSSGRLNAVRSVLLGFIPFYAWELFALLYYGFPFPNTAYAKLFTGIGQRKLIEQGFYYLADTRGPTLLRRW